MSSPADRLTVYRTAAGFSFWAGQGEPVELALSPGWSKGLSQFGKTMLIGPQNEALDIGDAVKRGVALKHPLI